MQSQRCCLLTALSGWRAPRKGVCGAGSCCLIGENLKFLRKRFLLWEESDREQERVLQRLKDSGDNHPRTPARVTFKTS